MKFEVIHTLIHILATIYAVVAASFALRLAAQHSNRALKRRQTELEADVDKLQQWFTKLNANMASIRASMVPKKQTPDDDEEQQQGLAFDQHPGETPEQWKRRMRQQMAAGGIRHK